MPDPKTPLNPGFIGGFQWKPLMTGVLFFLLWQQGITQFIAFRARQFGFSFDHPLLAISGWSVYQPFSWVPWDLLHLIWRIHNWRAPGPPFVSALHWSVPLFLVGCIVSRIVPSLVFTQSRKHLAADQGEIYGSTRWAKQKDLEENGLLQHSNGILLGLWVDPKTGKGRYLYDNSDRHVLLSASTGTGKSRTTVMGTLFAWSQSAIVLDIKEELYRATAGFRQRAGHVCLKFSPLENDGCARCNPLDFIRMGTPKEAADTQNLAEALGNPGNEDAKSEHWNDTSSSLIAGVILHEMYKSLNERGRRATFRDVSIGLSPFNQSFTEYLGEMATYEHDRDGSKNWKDPEGKPTKVHPFVLEKAREALNRPDNEAGSVLSTAKKRFKIFSDPLVNYATSTSDFTIADLVDAEQPVTLYLVVPPSDQDRLAPLLRTIFMTVMGRLSEKVEKHKHELLLLLDEFPRLGYSKTLEGALSYIRGYGMRAFLIVQDYGQIERRYGRTNEIINNCQIRITFACADLATAKTISETMGTFTIQHLSYSTSGGAHLLADKNFNQHVQNTKRHLLDPDEITRLKLPVKDPGGKMVTAPGETIVLAFGCYPIKGMQAFVHLDPEMRMWLDLPIEDQSQYFQRPDPELDVV